MDHFQMGHCKLQRTEADTAMFHLSDKTGQTVFGIKKKEQKTKTKQATKKEMFLYLVRTGTSKAVVSN